MPTDRLQKCRASIISLPETALVLVSLCLRCIYLDRVAGVNGDEAWYGYQFRAFLNGAAHTWFTPTHRLISPVLIALSLPLQMLLPPDVLTLRLPGVISGIAGVIACFWLLPKIFPRRIALFVALVMTSLPQEIIFARTCFEENALTAVVAVGLYFSWRGKWLGTGLTFLLALAVHTSNVFLLPFFAAPLAFDLAHSGRISRRWKVGSGVGAATAAAGLGFWLSFHLPETYAHLFRDAFRRVYFPKDILLYVVRISRVFHGSSFLSDFGGGISELAKGVLDAVTIPGIAVLAMLGIRRMRANGEGRRLWFVYAWLGTLYLLYLVGGSGFGEGHEYYTLPVTLPSILVAAFCLDAILPSDWRLREIGWWTGAFYLTLVVGCYFLPLMTTSSLNHRTYYTGPVEPKWGAFRWIAEDRAKRPGADSEILVEDWWVYWPIAYFSLAHPKEYPVVRADQDIGLEDAAVDFTRPEIARLGEDVRRVLQARGYLVSFDGQGFEQVVLRFGQGLGLRRERVPGYRGKGLLSVWHIKD